MKSLKLDTGNAFLNLLFFCWKIFILPIIWMFFDCSKCQRQFLTSWSALWRHCQLWLSTKLWNMLTVVSFVQSGFGWHIIIEPWFVFTLFPPLQRSSWYPSPLCHVQLRASFCHVSKSLITCWCYGFGWGTDRGSYPISRKLQEDLPDKVEAPLGAERESQAKVSTSHPQSHSLVSKAEVEAPQLSALPPGVTRSLGMLEKVALKGSTGAVL